MMHLHFFFAIQRNVKHAMHCYIVQCAGLNAFSLLQDLLADTIQPYVMLLNDLE